MIRHEVRFYAEFLSMRQVADCYNDWREALAPISGTLLEHQDAGVDEVGRLDRRGGIERNHRQMRNSPTAKQRPAGCGRAVLARLLRAGGPNRGASAWPSRNLAGKGTEGSARR